MTVDALLITIRISYRKVQHSLDDDSGGSSYDAKGKGKEVLAGLISQQEQMAFLQEDNAKRVEERSERLF